MSRVLDAFGLSRNIEHPSTPLTGANLLKVLRGGGTDSGVVVNEETAMRFSAVYRAVSLIAQSIAANPLHAYRRVDRRRREPYDSPVIRNPHPDMTTFELWEYALVSALMHGNSVQWKARDQVGRVRELWPLHPSDCRVFRDQPTAANPSGKLIEITDPPTGGQRTVTPYDVLHVPALSMDGVKGLSPIQHVARQSIGLALATERFGARMFGRGGLFQGVLEVEEELEEGDANRLKGRWRDLTAGPENQWSIPVLDKGAKYKPIGIPLQDAQFVELRKFQVDDIARVYGLPPHTIGSVEKSTSWGTGIEQQTIGLVVFTLRAWTVRFEQRISRELLPAGAYAKWSMEALMRGDVKSRGQWYREMRNAGVLSREEIRSWEELEPLDDVPDDVWMPKNTESIPLDGSGPVEEEDDDATDS